MKKSNAKVRLVCLCVAVGLLLCAAGGGIYYLLHRGNSDEFNYAGFGVPPDVDYPTASFDTLVADSSLVVSGTMTACSEPFGIRSVSGGGPLPYCDWTLSIDNVYRGENEADTVTVRVEQSTTYDFFAVGDSVLLFLYRPNFGGSFNTAGDYYYVAYPTCGNYTEEKTDNGIVLRSYDGKQQNLESFLTKLQALSIQYPVDEDRMKEAYIASIKKAYSDPAHVEKELASLEQYAEIVPLT